MTNETVHSPPGKTLPTDRKNPGNPQAPEKKNTFTHTAQLLRRKKLKGQEVGHALLHSLVHDFEQRDNMSPSALFSQEDLNRMVSALPSEHERRIYAEYVELHDSLIALFREAQGQLQQLQHGLFRLSSRLSLADRIEKLHCLLEPLSQNTLDPEIAHLPQAVRGIFPEDFQALLTQEDLRAELYAGRSRLVRPAYAWLLGYNTALYIMADGLSLHDLEILQIPLESVQLQAHSYDALVSRCADLLPEEEARSLHQLCPPLNLEKIRPDTQLAADYTHRVKQSGPGAVALLTVRDTVMSGWLEEGA